MKSISLLVCAELIVLGLLLHCGASLAQPAAPVERVIMKGGKLFTIVGGKTEPVEANLVLPGEIKVTTNGTFQVKQGKERKLKEGQTLSKDGTLLSPDGGIMPVVDHVTMKNGRVLMVKDGEPTALNTPVKFADGTSVLPDATIVSTKGERSRMVDGQLFKLDGAPLPSLDTITLKNGKVVVQKDGSLFPVPAGRSLTMSDGTKVLGDGSVIKADGSKVKLSEGQTLTVEGVARRGQ